MIPLLFAILSSSLLFVIFKLFPRFGIDTFQAIVFNYFTALVCGFLIYGNQWDSRALEGGNWPLFAVICAVLFISLFIIMGLSSQKNGVASTSIAVKMSMAMTILLMFMFYKEKLTLLKAAGIVFAILGIILVSYSKPTKDKTKKTDNAIWMLLILFVGSGILDFALNYVQKFELIYLTPPLFSAIGFGLAGILGFIVLFVRVLQKKNKFDLNSILAGIILGIPNFFSIFLLIVSYKSTGWTDTTVVSILSVSVVVTTSLIGFVIFKESISIRKIIGLFSAIFAIIVLYLANK